MSIFTAQTIKDTTKECIIKFTGTFTDNINEYSNNKIDVSLLSGALNSNNYPLSTGGVPKTYYETSIKRIWYSTNISSNNIELYWSGNTKTTILCINNKTGEYNVESSFPTISNNQYDTNGNIGLKTTNVSANNFYSIIIELHKNNRDYDAGQFKDPGAYNFILDTELVTEDNKFIITESGISIYIPR